MVKRILFQIIAATAGLWLATIFVPGVKVVVFPGSNFFGIGITAQWQLFLIFGITLGLLNFFVKPILDVITLPLRIITLGIFGIVINMALLWILDIMFNELSAPLIYPLLYTTLIIWGINFLISIFLLRKD